MLVFYHILVLAVIGLMAVIAAVNLIALRSLHSSAPPGPGPLVSVLLPARNEADQIGRCLASLSAQEYPSLEIIVLDDGSDDGTADIASDGARRDARIRVVHGLPLPAGWTGKTFACHQLSQLASGDLLLFTDADTIHAPHTVGAAVAELRKQNAGLLTVIPHQITGSFWEKTLLPLLHFVTWCFLPHPLVRLSRNPAFAMANGQFMLFRREAYVAAGGHESVRGAIVEDVWLSRRVKQAGYGLVIMDGGDAVSCRMYSGFSSIWQGFSKNLFPGFRYSLPAITAVMVLNLVTSVLPFFALVAPMLPGLHIGTWYALVVLQVLLLLGIRIAFAARFRMDVWPVFLHPVAMILLTGIAINSCRWVLTGGGARWKGRTYDFRHDAFVPQRGKP